MLNIVTLLENTVVNPVHINATLALDLLLPVILVVVIPEIKVMIVPVKKENLKFNNSTVLIVMINVFPVLNSLNVPNVLVLTEILMMTVIVYLISMKKMANVFLGKSVLPLVQNVIVMEIAKNVLTKT